MALHFFLALPLSSSPHSHLSLPFPKLSSSSSSSPPKPTLLLPSQNPNSQICRRRREASILFRRRVSSLATTQSTTEGGGNGEANESAEKLDRRRLIAQNIPWTCTAEDVRSLFERHGTVLDVELSMYNTSKNRGLAFITMSSEEEAYAALSSLHSYDMDGRVIKVEFSTSLKKKKKPSEPKVTAQKYNVYVGNLAWNVKSQDLRELFSTSGSVLSAQVIFQTKPRRPAGYGFVSFASIEEAEAAISTLNGKKFIGRPLRLGLSKLQNVEGSSNEDGKSDGDKIREVNPTKWGERLANSPPFVFSCVRWITAQWDDEELVPNNSVESTSLRRALQLSQSRAREAEKKAAAAKTDREQLGALLLEESLRLSAHRQWVNLLEVEVATLKNKKRKLDGGRDDGRDDALTWCLTLALCLGIGFALGRYMF